MRMSLKFLLAAGLTGLVFLSFSGSSYALSASSFRPGRIIDDSIFTNKSSMTVGEIQQFLDSKVADGSCDTSGSRPSTRWYASANRYYTHAEWGALNGNPAPFVCLTTYRENPTTKQTNLGNPSALQPGDGSMSAAEIILSASQQYTINPQVLLVLLQKEQSLITDDWPWLNQYQSATGAYCPDTAACDATKAGFGTQVREAARLFRSYMDDPWLYFIGNNYVLYNPNRACGGTNVYIENSATVALYHYTPYQPNAAALNNLYGTGDSCSAYGNRNFWRMFNDWFGITTGNGYEFVDAVNPPSTVLPNDVVGTQIRIRNRSGTTWYSDGNVPTGKHPVRLALNSYQGTPYANSADPAWIGTTNQIRMKETSVADGEIATFSFTFKAPIQQINSYFSAFSPVLDGVGFMPYIGLSFTTSTPMPSFGYSVTASSGLSGSMQSSVTLPASFSVRNTGNIVWWGETGKMPGAASTRLFTVSPYYHASVFYDSSTWLAANQVKLASAGRIDPGGTGVFNFNIKTPATNTTYTDNFGLILDGIMPYPIDNQLRVSIDVADYTYTQVSNTVPDQLIPGQKYDASVIIKNTGYATWYADGNVPIGGHPVRLMTNGYQPHSLFNPADPAWLTSSQIKLFTPQVAPGENAEFRFSFIAPYGGTVAPSNFKVVLDGVLFMAGIIQKNTSVPALQFSYTQQPGGVHPASTTLSPGQISTGKLILKNTSNFIWYNDATKPSIFRGGAVRLVMADPYYRNSSFFNSADSAWLSAGQIKMTTAAVNPGENAVFDFTWKAPTAPGTYKDKFSLVLDGYNLFPYIGMEFVSLVQ